MGYAMLLLLVCQCFWILFDIGPWPIGCSFESESVGQVRAAFGAQVCIIDVAITSLFSMQMTNNN